MSKLTSSFLWAVWKTVVGVVVFVLVLIAIPEIKVFAVDEASTEVTSSVTSIVTTIPNLETEVPQTTQTQAVDEVADPVTTDTPYETPVLDGEDDQTIFDTLGINGSGDTIDLILLITILSLAPSILIMMTCFTRIVISFSLLRNAMGIQQTPPNQVLIGLALFLSLFIMSPVIDEVDKVAYAPYKNGDITATEAIKEAEMPIKRWMLSNTSNDTMSFFIDLSGEDFPADEEAALNDLDFKTVVPAFILSEIKIGFQIGFMLYIPFLIIDIVVSSTLMSLGMIMLPPATIAMPFKVLLFVMIDGWTLLSGSLINGFNSVPFT